MLALLIMAQAATAQLPMPAFLAGCWEQRNGERWTEECWTAPRGGLMIGSGRDGTGDRINHWEYMRIERGADGALTFHGSPKGAPAVAFKATEASARQIIFVNAGHDFPQRVRYVRRPTASTPKSRWPTAPSPTLALPAARQPAISNPARSAAADVRVRPHYAEVTAGRFFRWAVASVTFSSWPLLSLKNVAAIRPQPRTTEKKTPPRVAMTM